MPEPKRAIKDSVFTYLFSQPEYARALYLQLHPEDTSVTEEDFRIVTLENVLTIGQYNDLGLQVRNKLIFLVEAQSTFSENIPLRMFLYLANTYKDYVEEHKLSLYREKRVSVPRPELHVVYTGDREDIPEMLRFSDIYEGHGSVELEVKVLVDDGSGEILDQYIEFSKIVDAQTRQYGRTQQALEETLKVCAEKEILMPFLKTREKEVVDIMTTLFSQEKVWEIERFNIARESEARGQAREREKSIMSLIKTVQELVSDKTLAVQKLMERYGLSKSAAEEKVNLYWQ